MDNQNEDPHTQYELIPPDGGWGWLVLLGCTLINFLLPGTIKSSGVLFIEFLETFEFSEVAASWIPALCYFLYCSLGPISNYLSSKFSYRTVTLIGGTFAVSGLILSYFATSLIHLCITYGFLFGTGTGLSFPPGIFIVTSYFQKYRGLVNGVAISGSAFGSMILPPLLRYLVLNYGVNGAILIMGGIAMNVWVGALLYHPVSWHMKRKPIQEVSEGFLGSTLHNTDTLCTNQSKEVDHRKADIEANPEKSIVSITKEKMETTLVYNPSIKKVTIVKCMSPRANCDESLAIGLPLTLRRSSSPTSITSNRSKCSYSNSTLSRLQPLEYASQVTLKSITESLAPRQSDGGKKSSQLAELLRTPIFLTILVSNATAAIAYTNFTIFLPVYATSLHYDKTASSCLLSVVAFFDLIGRIGGSSITDFLPFSKKYYFIIGLTMSGISLVLLPLAQNYLTLCVACAAFGLSSGTFTGVFVVTIVELLGEDKLTSSYTVSLFVNGFLQLIGPPICGLIYQHMRSFAAIISALGLTVSFGGGIWILPVLFSFKSQAAKEKSVKKTITNRCT